jgi:hypothetical protein
MLFLTRILYPSKSERIYNIFIMPSDTFRFCPKFLGVILGLSLSMISQRLQALKAEAQMDIQGNYISRKRRCTRRFLLWTLPIEKIDGNPSHWVQSYLD